MGKRGPKRRIYFDGTESVVRSDKIEIPDLDAMSRFEALQWLCRHTYPRGYSKPNPLRGYGGIISIGAKGNG